MISEAPPFDAAQDEVSAHDPIVHETIRTIISSYPVFWDAWQSLPEDAAEEIYHNVAHVLEERLTAHTASLRQRVEELERERVARGADLAGLEIENARLSAENQALRDRVPGTWIDVVGGLRKRTEKAEAEANRMREELERVLPLVEESCVGDRLPNAIRAALRPADAPVTQREM